MSTSWIQPAGSQFVTFSIKPFSEVTASCLISEHSGPWTFPVCSCSLFSSEPYTTSGCLMGVMKDSSPQNSEGL